MKSITHYENWKMYLAIWFGLVFIFCSAYLLNRSGNTGFTLPGIIESCEYSRGLRGGSIGMAYVRLEDGQRIRILDDSCSAGENILIVKKRGLLFFNTIYMRTDNRIQ